jgi:hypothetical protein
MRETAIASFDFVSLSRQLRSKKIKFTGLGAMPDHVRLSDLEPLFVCQACGHRGADIRPLS